MANELRSAEMRVLRGQGSGRQYRVPSTRAVYRASAPGDPPAVRTGAFRNSWRPEAEGATARIESELAAGGYVLGELLENGTSRMAARPYQEKILEKALPKAERIYKEPYG